jgi:hypothetical protein
VFAVSKDRTMDDEFPISYQGVPPGVPVLTRDGKQFGFLEHVLEVPEEDVFEGIVVWVGSGSWLDRRIQRDLSKGQLSAARRLEAFRHHDLRFVEADRVAAITVGYIRCDLDLSEAGALSPPTGAPVFYANAIDQAQPYAGRYGNQMYGGLFRRARWTQE